MEVCLCLLTLKLLLRSEETVWVAADSVVRPCGVTAGGRIGVWAGMPEQQTPCCGQGAGSSVEEEDRDERTTVVL